jgi:transketolase
MAATDRDAVARLAAAIRLTVIEMCRARGQGYAGQGLQLADILACLYAGVLRPSDRFVLSTGHSAIALWAALGETGVYGREELLTYGQDGSRIEESPLETADGFEITGGSLGQGLSQALGMALAARIRGEDVRVYCEVSDGELQEGQTWEALMAAAHHGVDNLIVLVDHNGEQADGRLADIMAVEPIDAKLDAFGVAAERVDGHDVDALLAALERAAAASGPRAIVCETVPGKGAPSLEAYEKVHYVRAGDEVWQRAVDELNGGPA